MRKVCIPGTGRLAAHFQHLDLAHHRIPVDALVQRQQAVGHREHRMGVALRRIFADQEGGGLPAAQQYPELLDELLQADRALGLALRLQHDRAERIDEDQRRREGLDLLRDARQHLVEIARRDVVAQIDEANRLIDLVEVEERELLLITQHLQRRFAEHGEEQRRPLPASPGRT